MKLPGLITTFAGVCVLASCVERPPFQPEESSAAVASAASAHGRERAFGVDAEFMQISRDAPGFGGMFYDSDGRLNVYLTEGAQRSAVARRNVLQRVARALQARGEVAEPAELVVLTAKRDFRQLHALRQQLAAVFGVPGVVFSDIDERSNELRLGVLAGVEVARIEQALGMAGVPLDAVRIETASPIRPVNHTLQNVQNPVAGGLQVAAEHPGTGWVLCTLGFNVLRQRAGRSERHFLTNSHCTSVMGAVTGTEFWQPLPPIFGAGSAIGTEVADPAFLACTDYPGFQCRFSDAALVRYNNTTPVKFGGIYRTDSFGTGSAAGSLVVEPDGRRLFTITGEALFPLAGEVLDKVGRTTGWTRGPAALTCADVIVGGVAFPAVLLCQDFVIASADAGDSGSPVFRQIGDSKYATLYGILWGTGTIGATQFYAFSAMSNVYADFGEHFRVF